MWSISTADVEPARLGEVGGEVTLANSIMLEIWLTFWRLESMVTL
jgi:hypothetical protein